MTLSVVAATVVNYSPGRNEQNGAGKIKALY